MSSLHQAAYFEDESAGLDGEGEDKLVDTKIGDIDSDEDKVCSFMLSSMIHLQTPHEPCFREVISKKTAVVRQLSIWVSRLNRTKCFNSR
jgi:hypothetical protein